VAELKGKLIERKSTFETQVGVNVEIGNEMSKERLKRAHDRMVEEFEAQFGKMHQTH